LEVLHVLGVAVYQAISPRV